MSLPEPDCLKPPWGMSDAIGMWSLTHTAPKSSVLAARMAPKTSVVHTDEASPYFVSLAAASTSSSESNGRATSTGPKISSCTHSASWSTSAMTVGW